MADLDIREITDAVEDAVTYPILTKEVTTGGDRAGAPAPMPGGVSLGRVAQSTIRDVLGWRYRADDPKGFVAALTKAVDLKEVEGHVEWTWKARPFMVQADMGEVTGAQASIYARAKVAIDHALPLLDGLKPLRPDADPENTESIRLMVRSALTELVGELGIVGGPRIQRVDSYFVQLLRLKPGRDNVVPKRLKDGSLLRELEKRFGLDSDAVLTIQEEQDFTDFIILVDHTTSLYQTWNAQRLFLSRSGKGAKFLGTELVRLSQVLAVIVESVHEAYDAMDSVFFGPEERQVTQFELKDADEPPITVAELLSWIERFAGVEAPQLIEDSGKDGVKAVKKTLDKLSALLDQIAPQ
jgi:hypothetical protein